MRESRKNRGGDNIMRGVKAKLSQADINKLIKQYMMKQKKIASNKIRPANANISQASLQNLIKKSGSMLQDMGPRRAAKGGKMKKKFPDLSGDGKITKKDILMARGVIKKPKKKKTK